MVYYANSRLTGTSDATESVFSYTALTILSPLPTGAAPSGLDTNHPVYRAYTGLSYSITAAASGGYFPYTYSLTNPGSGMTINSTTGVITWPNPSGSCTPTLRVTDYNGNFVTSTWTVTAGTSGYKFVDAVGGSDGAAGTLAAPWQTMLKVWQHTTITDIIYFRAGTYTQAGITEIETGTAQARTDWDDSPCAWRAYPGDAAPIIDLESTGVADYTPHIAMQSEHQYLDGFRVIRAAVKAFAFTGRSERGAHIRNCSFESMTTGGGGENAAYVFTTTARPRIYGFLIQDTTFDDIPTEACTIKMYDTIRCLIERTTHTNTGTESIAMKIGNLDFTVRQNNLSSLGGDGLGGNWQDQGDDGHEHYGEFCFNNVVASDSLRAVHANQNDTAGPTYLYRNTLKGRVTFAVVTNGPLGVDDGPFVFNANIIENAGSGNSPRPYFYYTGTVDNTRITESDNLKGASGDYTNASGALLNGAYRGQYGHELV